MTRFFGLFKCAKCGQRLQSGSFMAVIGRAPPDGWSMPVGRTDKIIDTIGEVYCERCFARRWRRPRHT